MKLHATVTLCGARIKAVRLGKMVGFYGVTENSRTSLSLNPVKVMEDAAAILGIEA